MQAAINRQRGFTLLELMVSVLVLSIGLIGLAGLQLIGVQNGRDAYNRTQAVMLAYDIIDRMRANLQGVTDGNYHLQSGTKQDACRTAGGCTTLQMAQDDVFLWRQAVASDLVLPGGSAVVCRDSTPGDVVSAATPNCDNAGTAYVVHIWWNDDRNPATADARLSVPFIP